MNARERILLTLAHQRPDRPPTDGWFHPEVIEALKEHFQTERWEDVLAELGIEGWASLSAYVIFPGYNERATARPRKPGAPPKVAAKPRRLARQPKEQPVVENAPRAIWLDADTYEDPWGIRFRMGEDDRYQQWLGGPLQEATSPDDIRAYRFPSPADVREPDNYAARVARFKREGLFVSGGLENPFKRLWHLRGYENALMDYASDPDMVDAIYEPLFALNTELALRMTRAGVDMINVVGDVAMQDRIIMGPDLWRRFDKPRWAKLLTACRAINPHLHFFFHSDGKLTDLMDDLIEVGFDVINPIQPECMDPFEVKKRWGNRITLHGCISIQRTLPFGSVADVRHEVESLIRGCGHDGGLVLMPSNVIQPDTPVENIVACYHTVKNFRW